MITGTDGYDYEDLTQRFLRNPASTRRNATLKRLEGGPKEILEAWKRNYRRYELAGEGPETCCDQADFAVEARKHFRGFYPGQHGESPGTTGQRTAEQVEEARWERSKLSYGIAPSVYSRLAEAERTQATINDLEGQVCARSDGPVHGGEPITFDDGSNYEPYSLPYPV